MNMKPLVDSKSKEGEIWDRIPIAITKKRKADYESERQKRKRKAEEAKVNKKKQEIKSITKKRKADYDSEEEAKVNKTTKEHHYCEVCKNYCYGLPSYKVNFMIRGTLNG
jgi:shikimate kinase